MSLLDDEEDILRESDEIVENWNIEEFANEYMMYNSQMPIFMTCFYEYNKDEHNSILRFANLLCGKPQINKGIIYPASYECNRLIIQNFSEKDLIYKGRKINISKLPYMSYMEILLLDCHPELLKDAPTEIRVIRRFKDAWINWGMKWEEINELIN